MEVVFGWFLDGLTYPENVSGQNSAFNSLVCGPSGLLNLLEVFLGTGGPSAAQSLRMAEYLTAAEQADDGKQFYSASFAVNPWSTTAKLLQMRDQLMSGGWNGTFVPSVPRTNILAAIEKSILPLPGFADRLIRAHDELNRVNRNPITKLLLAMPMSHLPALWQTLLERLAATGTAIEDLRVSSQSANCDLHSIQNALLTGARTTLSGDGTFTILDSDNQIQAGELVAACLQSLPDTGALLIIRGQDTSALNEACSRNGLPRIGGCLSSPHRAILQVLPLAFELTWRPFNSYRCLEFLSLSGGPIPHYVTRLLKDALKRQPGLEGPHWQSAWTKLAELHRTRLLEKHGTTLSESEIDTRLETDIASYKAWFEPITTVADSLNSSDIEAVCRRVESWATKRAAVQAEHSLYAVAAGHAAELATIVNGFGTRALNIHQLRSIINTVIAEGASDTANGAEATRWNFIDRPGQLWGPVDSVIWWDFASSDSLPALRDLWSPQEINDLAQNNIQIDPVAQQALREAHSWLCPVLNCRKNLILVRPRTVAGKISTMHPLWDEITAVATDDELQKATVDGTALLSTGELVLAGSLVNASKLPQTGLPKVLQTWSLPPGLVKPRQEESFTSMERLLACPLSWTFEYSGNIRPGALQALPEIDRLTGDFAHAVVANLFSEQKQWEIDQAKARSAEIIDELLPKLAAPLLLPANTVQLRKTKQNIVDAISHLISILKDKELEVEGCEVNRKATLGDYSFGGSIDLLLKNAQGGKVVLDLKWSRFPNTFRRKLVEGNALQLASYSWLINSTEEDGHGYAPTGFYLLRQGRLFSDSSVIANDLIKAGRTMQETWTLAQELHSQTSAVTCGGKVIATGLEPSKLKPFIEPPCNICNYSHFCGVKELV